MTSMLTTKLKNRLSLSLILTLALTCSCGSHRSVVVDKGEVASGQTTGKQPSTTSAKLSKRQKAVMEEAKTWLGTPYQYGHAEKGEGTDCSGMVMMVYEKAADIKLPRNSAKQAAFCDSVSAAEAATGDLVFFATGKDPEKITHVGILMEDVGRFIHASSTKGVCVSEMASPYFSSHLIMYGRVK